MEHSEKFKKEEKTIQLTVEQHMFELHGFTYTWIFSNKCGHYYKCIFSYDFLNNFFFSLVYI